MAFGEIQKTSDYNPDSASFNIRRTQKDGTITYIRVADLLPGGICAYLVHGLIPYILTLYGGGAFPWMESVDPRAVDVQCPNPAGAVSVRLRLTETGFSIRVLKVRGYCPKGYIAGYDLEMPATLNIPLIDLNVLLSWLMQLNSVFGAGRTPEIQSPLKQSSYQIERETGGVVSAAAVCPPHAGFRLNLSRFDHRCRYHKLPRREKYDQYNWIPNGMCPELFHAAYPSCLAMIYDGGSAVPNRVACPQFGWVRLKIRVEERSAIPLRRAAMHWAQLLGINTEIPMRRCFLLVEEASDTCPFEMKAGREFEFNMGELRELCPAMFHNAYPAIDACIRGAAFPWPGDGDNRGAVQCPDNVSNITMIYEK